MDRRWLVRVCRLRGSNCKPGYTRRRCRLADSRWEMKSACQRHPGFCDRRNSEVCHQIRRASSNLLRFRPPQLKTHAARPSLVRIVSLWRVLARIAIDHYCGNHKLRVGLRLRVRASETGGVVRAACTSPFCFLGIGAEGSGAVDVASPGMGSQNSLRGLAA